MVRIFGSAAPRRRAVLALVSVAAMVLSLGIYSALAASLPGSTFEIDTDANLVVEHDGQPRLGTRHPGPPGR